MRFAIDVAPLGEFADPRAIARVAAAAEAAGWDGLSTWDVLATTMGGAADPFVALAAAAAATERIRLIASVVALPRRRPQLVAQAAASLDLLSGGRLILGIGAGGDRPDFEAFGEAWEGAVRIVAMDEAAGLVDAWLRGQSVRHGGEAFVARDVAVGPPTIQRPRPPIWFGGSGRPGALRRAARWDGWIAVSIKEDGVTLGLTPEAFAPLADRVRDERTASRGDRAFDTRQISVGDAPPAARLAAPDGLQLPPFDIAVFGQDRLGGATAAEFGEAGASWWLESFSPMRGSLDTLLGLVSAGPPSG